MTAKLLLLLLPAFGASAMDKETFNALLPFRECLGKSNAGLCLKERAVDALNETIMSDQPLNLFDIVEIERNPKYHFNTSATQLPQEAQARSMALTDILQDKIEEFFKSRVFKFSMSQSVDVEEGRGKGGGGGYGGGGGGKGDKGKGGGMMILMMGGMACMMAQMFMGKIAFMAGTALVVAKIALFLSAIIGLKKLSSGGDGGKETSHVVYASGHDHGHGGWHRSLSGDAQEIAYRAHITDPAAGY